jgi:signal transduction histidine kinase
MHWARRKRKDLESRPARWEVEVESLADGQQISCRVTNSILKYLSNLGLDPARVVEGLPVTLQYLEDPFNWTNCAVRDELTQRAKSLSGDEDFMYHMALESARLGTVGGVDQMVRLLASPRMVYRLLPHYAKFFDRTCDFRVRFTGPNRATVTLVWSTDYPITKDRCRYTQGMLKGIPTLWDLPPAGLEETFCGCGITRGAVGDDMQESGCTYDINWTPLPRFFVRVSQYLKARRRGKTDPTAEFERNFHLLDLKNSQVMRRNRQLAAVRDLALALARTSSLPSILEDFSRQVVGISGLRWVEVLSLENTGGVLKPEAFETAPGVAAGMGSAVYLRVKLDELGLPPREDVLMAPRTVELDPSRLSALGQDIACFYRGAVAGNRVLAAPVIIQTRLWGFTLFGVSGDVPEDILEMCSAHLATAIQASSMLQSVEARNNELTAINAVAHSMASSLDLGQLLVQAAQATSRAFRSGVAVHLLDDEGSSLVLRAQAALMPGILGALARVPLAGTRLGWFIASGGRAEEEAGTGSAALLHGAGLDPSVYEHSLALLRSEGRPTGVLTVIRSAGRGFTDNESSLLRSIGNQLSVAIDNARLHQDVQKRMEEAEAARADLQQALARQTEFNRILVHEIKTPLTSILACSELMRSELQGAAAFNLGGLIDRSAHNLNQRVDELVDLSKGELGKLQIHVIATDLLDIIKDVYRQFTVEARQKHLRFSMEIPAAMDYVLAEESRVRQVLANLLSNAFKNTPDGGSVVIRAHRERGEACVVVADTGRGIPEAEVPWLFNPYHRRSCDQQRLGGLGLGLPLSKYIVELHGGRLELESAPGVGTTVSFTLPMADEPAARTDFADSFLSPG